MLLELLYCNTHLHSIKAFSAHVQATGDALQSKEVHENATASSNSSMATLVKENVLLKARLQRVEEAATDALGELQDARDEVDAHKQAIKGAEQQV